MTTTVHGIFFSKENKEYVSTSVFKNVKDKLGIELDETFLEILLVTMADVYKNTQRPHNIDINSYVSILNNNVIIRCIDKCKTSNISKLAQKEASEREYQFKETSPIPSTSSASASDPSSAPSSAFAPSSVPSFVPSSVPSSAPSSAPSFAPSFVPASASASAPSSAPSSATKPKSVNMTLDFRKDLVDIDEDSYCLVMNNYYTHIIGIEVKKLMIELCEPVVNEPYIYVDIENIIEEDKHYTISNNQKVLGRMVQTNTICNKSMYIFEQEDCMCSFNEPIDMNHIYLTLYDYTGSKISLKNINVYKVINIENTNKNQILTSYINIVKPNSIIDVCSNKTFKKYTLWKNKPLVVKESKSNSIIVNEELKTNKSSKLVLEKEKINCNISIKLMLQ